MNSQAYSHLRFRKFKLKKNCRYVSISKKRKLTKSKLKHAEIDSFEFR
jgi:hypothetical protein